MNRRRFLDLPMAAASGTYLHFTASRIAAARSLQGSGPSKTSGLGINLTGLTDWNREHPFVDPFRLSRTWISQAEGKHFGQGPPLELDEHGWVRRLQPGCWAETLLYTNQKDHIPEGRYRIDFRGRGRIDTGLNARFVGQSGQVAAFDVARHGEGVSIRIRETDPNDPIRDIRITPPGIRKLDPAEPFRKDFLDLWRGMGFVRFMDWMGTNNSEQIAWKDRPKLEDATWTTKGAPVETIVQLANRLRCDAWICLPHQADNEYVRNMAESIREKLDAGLRVWVELSNETWNGIFKQSHYFRDLGRKGGFAPGNDYQGQLEAYSMRAVQVFRLFDNVFRDQKHRVVRILSAQSVNQWTSETVLGYQNAFRSADALAIAPYFGNDFGDPKNAEEIEKLGVDEFMPRVAEAARASRKAVDDSLKVARKYGLPLAAYEAGQHLVGHSGAENREKLTELFHAANRHPGMERIYADYLAAWKQAGGGPMCLFASISEYSKWGSWGLKEWPEDPPARSPKFAAVRQFEESGGRWWSIGRKPEKA